MHVALGNAGKSLDRGTVEPDAILQCLRQLVYRDRNIFNHPHNICKLQIDKLDMSLFNTRLEVSCGVGGGIHGCLSRMWRKNIILTAAIPAATMQRSR